MSSTIVRNLSQDRNERRLEAIGFKLNLVDYI